MKRLQPARETRPTLRRRVVFTFVSVLFAAASLAAEDARSTTDAELRDKADEIRTAADDLFKLRRIPWVTDPAEGFRLAREENRPVFLYVQAGDPLEDC